MLPPPTKEFCTARPTLFKQNKYEHKYNTTYPDLETLNIPSVLYIIGVVVHFHFCPALCVLPFFNLALH
jgi:hypothetical protein